MNTRRFWLWAALSVLLLFGSAVHPVLAHPIVVRTEPAQNEQLATSPERVRVIFNEPLEPLSTIQLYNAQGQVLAEGGLSDSDPAVLELVPPPLDPGVYTVLWRVVGSDGHLVPANYAFRVGQPGEVVPDDNAAPAARPLGPTTTLTTREPPVVPAALLRALMLIGALGAVGSWSFSLAVLQPTLAAQSEALRSVAWRRWQIGVALCLALLLLATPVFALLHTFHIAGQIDPASIQQVVLGTRLGWALVARWLLALVALVFAVRGPINAHGWLALLLSGALLATFALSGHAVAQAVSTLPVLADWLHLAATALWVGGLLQFVVLLSIWNQIDTDQRVPTLASAIDRFSPLALASVLILTITGTYAALLHMSAWSELWTTSYGQVLLLKIGLFGGLLLLGAYNLLLVRPRFRAWTTRAAEAVVTNRWQRMFVYAVRGEVILALLVVVAAGALTSLAPASGDTHDHGAADPSPTYTPIPSVPFDQTQIAGDLHVRLEITPASISQNEFQVTVTDMGGEPLQVQLVRLELDMPDMNMGVTQLELPPTGLGQYATTASPLSMIGEWEIGVLVRREDAQDVRAIFTVPVGE